MHVTTHAGRGSTVTVPHKTHHTTGRCMLKGCTASSAMIPASISCHMMPMGASANLLQGSRGLSASASHLPASSQAGPSAERGSSHPSCVAVSQPRCRKPMKSCPAKSKPHRRQGLQYLHPAAAEQPYIGRDRAWHKEKGCCRADVAKLPTRPPACSAAARSRAAACVRPRPSAAPSPAQDQGHLHSNTSWNALTHRSVVLSSLPAQTRGDGGAE